MTGAKTSDRCDDQIAALGGAAGWRRPLVQLLVFALALPIAATFVNRAAMQFGESGRWKTNVLLSVYSLYILEIGVIGYVIGVGMGQSLMKWVVFVWAMALIDLQMFITIAHMQSLAWRGHLERELPHALFAGQVGMFTIWGVLGGTPIKRRLPLVALALVPTIYLGFAGNTFSNESSLFLFSQMVATIGLCGLIWAFGFCIEKTSQPGEPRGLHSGELLQSQIRQNVKQGASAIIDNTLPQGRRMQFSLWHVFLWVSGLALLLAIARLLDWTFVRNSGALQLFELVCVSVGLATVSLVALWSALGKERFWIRIVMLIVLAPLIGTFFGTMQAWADWGDLWVGFRGTWKQFFEFTLERAAFWVTWTMLSSFFLSAMLAVFRASGYGLFRRASVSSQ